MSRNIFWQIYPIKQIRENRPVCSYQRIIVIDHKKINFTIVCIYYYFHAIPQIVKCTALSDSQIRIGVLIGCSVSILYPNQSFFSSTDQKSSFQPTGTADSGSNLATSSSGQCTALVPPSVTQRPRVSTCGISCNMSMDGGNATPTA